MALILSGLASMPFRETGHPSTFPLVTLKMYFSRFNFNQASCVFANVLSDQRYKMSSFFTGLNYVTDV
jgi:hypothetical protein